MSMVKCNDCGGTFSSDNDPDCFVEVGNMRRMNETIILCDQCRERREMEFEVERSP